VQEKDKLQELSNSIVSYYPIVKTWYDQLVPPNVISHDTFWTNYVFKVAFLTAQENQRALLLEKVQEHSEEEDVGR
jgi:hypothetical protein